MFSFPRAVEAERAQGSPRWLSHSDHLLLEFVVGFKLALEQFVCEVVESSDLKNCFCWRISSSLPSLEPLSAFSFGSELVSILIGKFIIL